VTRQPFGAQYLERRTEEAAPAESPPSRQEIIHEAAKLAAREIFGIGDDEVSRPRRSSSRQPRR
jgi:hypothetical protein